MVKLNTTKLANYCFIAFWSLVVLTKLLQVGLIFYVAIPIGIVGIFLGDDSFRVSFCLMLVPNIRMFDGLGTTFIVNIMLVTPLFAKLLTDRKVSPVALAHTFALATLELAHILFRQTYSYVLPNMAAILMLLYVETILLDRNTKLNFPDIVRKFAFGSIFSACVYFIVYSLRYDMSKYLSGSRYTAYASDPNYFSLYMCLAIALIFVIKQHKKRDYAYIILLAFIVLFTYSKMALLVLLLIFLYFAGKTVLHGFSYRTRFIRRFLLAGIALAAVFSRQIANLLDTTFSRLREHNGTNVNINTITSNRVELSFTYLYALITDPILLLFGYGLQYNEVYDNNLSHNTFLDVVLSWGISGVILFVVIFYTIIRRLIANCPDKLGPDHFYPLFILGVVFFSLSCLSASMFWWVILAALLPLKGIEDKNESPAYLGNRAGIQRRKIRVRVRSVSR